MKRIVSVLITILLISNIFQSTLITNASDASCNQEPFVTYDALVTGNSDVTPNITDAGFIDIMDGAPLYPIFEKRNYMTNELISVQLELTASLVGVDTTYDTSGFSVIGDISSSFNDCNCQTYTVVLAYDGVTPNPYFTFGVVTNDGSTVYTKVYGHLSNYGLFISDSSHDAARELSYYHLVELGILTPAEYNQILQNEYSQLGVEIIHDVARIDPVLTQQYVDSSEISTTSSVTATTITGYIGWTDDNGVTHPMQYNRIEIWDSVYNECLDTVYTNESGEYISTVNQTIPYHNIYI